MSDPGDEYLELLRELLQESRRLAASGRLRDSESLRELASLEMEATTTQFTSYLKAPTGNIVFLPNVERGEQSRRLREGSARTRSRSAALRGARRPAAGA